MNQTRCILPRLPALVIAGTLFVLCAVAPAWAEQSRAMTDSAFKPQSTVYFELAGSAVIYSVNYDYRATRHTAVRAGIEFFANSNSQTFAFPVTVSALIGAPGRGSFEIGGGAVFLAGDDFGQEINPDIVLSSFVAFRFQPPEGGYFMRVGIGPVLGVGGDFDGEWIIWPGLSVGYSF